MKPCFKCGTEKPLSEFYRHPRMADGHLNKCKSCAKSDATSHRNENIDSARAYDRERAKLNHRIANSKNVTARRRSESHEVYKAQTAVNNAIRDGRLKKPNQCQCCGIEERIHGHHDDYRKPLEVIWLCVPCHAERHKQLKQMKAA